MDPSSLSFRYDRSVHVALELTTELVKARMEQDALDKKVQDLLAKLQAERNMLRQLCLELERLEEGVEQTRQENPSPSVSS